LAWCACVHKFGKCVQLWVVDVRCCCCRQFGSRGRQYLVRFLHSTVAVRVGGGWMQLGEFLDANDPCRGTWHSLSFCLCVYLLMYRVYQHFRIFRIFNDNFAVGFRFDIFSDVNVVCCAVRHRSRPSMSQVDSVTKLSDTSAPPGETLARCLPQLPTVDRENTLPDTDPHAGPAPTRVQWLDVIWH